LCLINSKYSLNELLKICYKGKIRYPAFRTFAQNLNSNWSVRESILLQIRMKFFLLHGVFDFWTASQVYQLEVKLQLRIQCFSHITAVIWYSNFEGIKELILNLWLLSKDITYNIKEGFQTIPTRGVSGQSLPNVIEYLISLRVLAQL